MRFEVDSAILAKELKLLSTVIESTRRSPILDNILFCLEGETLYLEASDLDNTLKTALAIRANQGGGSFCLPAELLLSMIKTFKLGEELVFTNVSKGQDKRIKIESEYGYYEIPYVDADDFPRFETKGLSGDISIGESELKEGITNTLYAVPKEDLRKVLTGICVNFKGSEVDFVGTDSMKIVCHRIKGDFKENVEFILPKKSSTILKSILEDGGQAIIKYSKNQLYVKTETDREFFFYLIGGKFPNYERILPKESANRFIVDKKLLAPIIKRVGNFSDTATYETLFNFERPNKLSLTSGDSYVKVEATETLEGEYEGSDTNIKINSRHISEVLSKLKSNRVRFEFSSPTSPFVVKPIEEEPKNELICLLMPINQ